MKSKKLFELAALVGVGALIFTSMSKAKTTGGNSSGGGGGQQGGSGGQQGGSGGSPGSGSGMGSASGTPDMTGS